MKNRLIYTINNYIIMILILLRIEHWLIISYVVFIIICLLLSLSLRPNNLLLTYILGFIGILYVIIFLFNNFT